jgi:predicted nucleic acid-binding Zn ribbon protein
MFDDCESLNDIARKYFGKANYTNREKSKKLLSDNGIDWHQWLVEKKECRTKHCIVCGKKLEKQQTKFCSHGCAASFNNRARKKKIGESTIDEKTRVSTSGQEKVTRYCEHCGKELLDRQKRFCSSKCQRDYDYNQYITAWKNGEVSGMRSATLISQHIKRYMLEKTGCACEICGCNWVNPKSGKPIVEIHHIDGDAFNNKEDNLQVLCPNHHAMTETFKNNNEKGRSKRLKEK